MCETNSFARMESLCLFNFGLRSRIRNMFLIRDYSLCLFNFGLRSRIRNMFLIRDLKPKLNKQSDSIRAKLFVSHILFTSFYTLFSHSPILIVCMQILASYFLSHCFRNCIYAELFYPWTWNWKWPWSGRNVVRIFYRLFLSQNVLLKTYNFWVFGNFLATSLHSTKQLFSILRAQ